MGDSLTQIAVLLIGVALVALLVNRSGGTSQIISAGTQGFGNLLKIVTLQPTGGAGGMNFQGGYSGF